MHDQTSEIAGENERCQILMHKQSLGLRHDDHHQLQQRQGSWEAKRNYCRLLCHAQVLPQPGIILRKWEIHSTSFHLPNCFRAPDVLRDNPQLRKNLQRPEASKRNDRQERSWERGSSLDRFRIRAKIQRFEGGPQPRGYRTEELPRKHDVRIDRPDGLQRDIKER